MTEREAKIQALSEEGDYVALLQLLSELRESIDAYFDKVMVMADDKDIRSNRLMTLWSLRGLFLRAADISRLQ